MNSDSLSAIFAALADPTRRQIVERLALGPATVQQLAAPFPISAPAISRHLRVLAEAGLIVQGREAQWRPCQLDATPLREVAAWAEKYRRFWEGSLDHLEVYLADLQAPKAERRKPGTGSRAARRPKAKK
jgi:DNA-binding transcriptional ArsR family regulator